MKLSINEASKVVTERVQERIRNEDVSWNDALTEELTKEIQKKSHGLTDQSKVHDTNKNIFDNIIAPGEDIDNGEVFQSDTGETIRDLDYKGEI